MIILKRPDQLHDFLEKKKKDKNQLGFIPTMGALHQGHVSLVKIAKDQDNLVVCSIFVNPTQFNYAEDFKKYPITLEKDILMFENAGCDVLFIPSVDEIYPTGTAALEHYDLGVIETILEGKFRPGHFQGVCQVMHRLLEIVLPNNLYLGQKDYQQCMVIKKLIELVKLDKLINVIVCPTLREDDGLAMSSRNTRLSPNDRPKATTISAALRFIKEKLKPGDPKAIKNEAKKILLHKGFRIDYVEIADADTLELIADWDGKQKVVALAAAILNNVRLIDNMVIDQ